MVDHRIDTFLTLCECMNYRKTAELLHITQPAVTQQIHFLEQEYSCKLFTFENRKLQKTKSAETLEMYARAMRRQDISLRESLSKPQRQTLKIGATKTIGDYYLHDHIHQYLQNDKNDLTFIVDNTKHLLTLLDKNKLDFTIVEGFFDKDRYDSILLRKEPFVGICRKDHPFCGKAVTMEQMLSETIIHREEGSGTRAILEQKLMGYNESLHRFPRQICISSFKQILDLVKTGFGISFVYSILADSDPDLGQFQLEGEPIIREFNIVYLKHADLRQKIDWFFPQKNLP